MPDTKLLRSTFNENAKLYDQWRPNYPEQLYQDMISDSVIPKHGHILEVGLGTGQATYPMLLHGYRVTAVELGHNLAEFTREKFHGFPNLKIITGAFEDVPLEECNYDLLMSATAFHWIDSTIAYMKAWSCLRPEGAIALFWNEHVKGKQTEPFFEDVLKIYEQVVPEHSINYKGLMRPDKLLELKDRSKNIQSSGLFGSIQTRTYQRDIIYDSTSYCGLLRTFSDMIALTEDKREELLARISELIDRKHGGRIVKTYLTVLHVAKRLG